MQGIQDIFQIWPSVRDMATEIEQEYDTVLRWRLRGRIPEDSWDIVIQRAARHGKLVTAAQLLALNRPIKQRGRPRKDRTLAASA